MSSGHTLHPRGGEFWGTVEGVGAAVTTIQPRDLVFGITFGTLGNRVQVKRDFLYKISTGALAEVSLLCSCCLSVYRC